MLDWINLKNKNKPNTIKTMPISLFKPNNTFLVTSGRKYFAPIILRMSTEKKVLRMIQRKSPIE